VGREPPSNQVSHLPRYLIDEFSRRSHRRTRSAHANMIPKQVDFGNYKCYYVVAIGN
jgi:hypothetical protein